MLFHFHCKQDAEDNAQLVNGDDTVFIHLVDYDLVDGQLAYAAGGLPSKSHWHEWMVSKPLLGYLPTQALSLCKHRMVSVDMGNLLARDS